VPRPASEDRRWERTRRALLDGGRKVMAELGVDAASIRQIVAEAGVSQPSFYNHFESKDALVAAILRDFFERDGERKAQLFEASDDPALAVAIGARTTLQIAARDPLVAWMVVKAGPARNLLQPSGRPDVLAIQIEAGVRAGRFQPCDAKVAAGMIRGSTLPTLEAMLEGRAAPDTEAQFAALILRMLGLDAAEALELASRPQ
jgi:AcrR family transcriptional regulator